MAADVTAAKQKGVYAVIMWAAFLSGRHADCGCPHYVCFTVPTVRSLASGVDALVVTNQSSKNVGLAGRFTDLPVVNVRAEVDLGTDEYASTVERQERETDGSIGGWGSSERRKTLIRAAAHDAVRDGRDAASPPTIRQLDRRQARTRRFDTDKGST
jgi:hypothetical protein